MFENIKNLFSPFKGNRENMQKVLLIESRYKTLQFLDRTLSTKYSLLIAQDKEDGLNKVQLEKPDLIILNSRLNKERTLDLCFAIRANEHSRNVPILIIAEKGDDSNSTEFFMHKIEGYFSEPFTAKEILNQVQLALNNRK